MSVQADGKVLISGFFFTTVGGQTRNRIARLNTNGTLDSAFNPNANERVRAIVVQADGKILIGGAFTSVGGLSRNGIARLNTDGTLESTFNPNTTSVAFNPGVHAIAMQADNKILIGGAFTSVGGLSRNNIARLNTDGTVDSALNPNTNNFVSAIALQIDSKILIGGAFTTVGGLSRARIARLNINSCDSIPINLGQTINGSLLTTDCFDGNVYSDQYTFVGAEGQRITITMDSTAFQPLINLSDRNGQPVNLTNTRAVVA